MTTILSFIATVAELIPSLPVRLAVGGIFGAVLGSAFLGYLPIWAAKRAVDQSILFSCENVPTPKVMPDSGRIYMLSFQGRFQDTVSIQTRGGVPTGSPLWDDEQSAPPNCWRCTFKNHSGTPVFNLAASLAIKIFAPVTAQYPAGYVSVPGPLIEYIKDVPLPIVQQLGANGSGSSDLYILNEGPNYIEVALPTSAHVQPIGSKLVSEISLIKSEHERLSFAPRTVTPPDQTITEEMLRRRRLMQKLLAEWFERFKPPLQIGSMAPIFSQAIPWLNRQLKERGETWEFNLQVGREMDLLR